MTPLHDFNLHEWERSVTLHPAMLLLSGSITIAQPLSGDVNKSVLQKVDEDKAGLTPVRIDMVALLRRRPYLFLHEMLMQGHIEANIYWKAYMEKTPRKCEKFIREEVESVKKDGELEEVMVVTRSNERDFLAMLQLSERCSPTVNPNSVYSDLRLSVDLRTVTLSSERHSYPHHPERFENSAQALCREGFSSGAHYWEVDVGGAEQFRVGVACATLPRGGSAEAQLLGAGADSWCLWRREGGYAASHHGRHTALAAVRPPPRKIGVHLRWEEGLLSFYCADTRRRLHSFNATAFPSHLYPALCVHKGTVTILRLSLRFEEGEGPTGEVGKRNDEERAEENGRQSKAGVASDVAEGGGEKSEVGDSGAGKSEGWESARVNPDPEAQDGGAVVNAAGKSGDATKEDVETFTDNVKSKDNAETCWEMLSKAGIKSVVRSGEAVESELGQDGKVQESDVEESEA
ncbi:butyrophilin-like protein 9 isoform X1 [Lethenteron reissneri]|uniref:butyrophilin-like protein 9 isoform X1 n=2 Tax=Lethenteron reissneri TaxID=7753 RepID=UPI002AB6E664|nr:butyrophilin-like protein 9 isoform X1 [Lethenteron reissneri]